MILRKPTVSVWRALAAGLQGREPRFVVRESLPEDTLAWELERLPLVLVSSDLGLAIQLLIPKSFADAALAPIRRRLAS